ncbi:MAG: hypothetical protein ABFD50_09105 [Smithella sp.]
MSTNNLPSSISSIPNVNIYFSDYFHIDPMVIDQYGAFNISVINDLPLFIDPFLLFISKKEEYQNLHKEIIHYLRFLRDKSLSQKIDEGLLHAWFMFREVKQTWFGFSKKGNNGSGLGRDFAIALNQNLVRVFRNFGDEPVTKGSHLEKLCLISEGVGRDNISDFSTNLIKGFLAEYTQRFATDNIRKEYRKIFNVPKTRFNYQTEKWESSLYELPNCEDDFILLAPKDLLTKDTIWINREDLVDHFSEIAYSVTDVQLRSELNNYLVKEIPEKAKQGEKNKVYSRAYRQFPELLEYYIKYKEDHGDEAISTSRLKVKETKQLYHDQVTELIESLQSNTSFYEKKGDTLSEAYDRAMYMKHVIEDMDGYKLFYVNDEPVKRETDLHIIFKFTWFASPSDMNSEVNNGRGPVDFKISRGDFDKTIIEFKLASNSKLKTKLQSQVDIYKKANNTKKAIKVIVYFSEQEFLKVRSILEELEIINDHNIILIDARSDNKTSASKA